MWKYILKRIIYLIPVMVGVTFLVFTLLYLTPGDPARLMLGQTAPEEAVEKLRTELGLDKPFIVQYGNYMKDLIINRDIGVSYATGSPVTEELKARLPNTLKLAFSGMLVGAIVAIPIGVLSAVKQYSLFDSLAMMVALIGISMPLFWLGILMILLFSVKLGWLPSSGYDTFQHMIMPALALGFLSMASITRMTRSSMLEIIRQDYITTARSKGQKESIIIIKHAFRNALIPIVTVIGLSFATNLGGTVLTETIFSIPGIGRLLVSSIKTRDYPVVQGSVLFIALSFSVINLIVDIIYAYLDPRIKAQYK